MSLPELDPLIQKNLAAIQTRNLQSAGVEFNLVTRILQTGTILPAEMDSNQANRNESSIPIHTHFFRQQIHPEPVYIKTFKQATANSIPVGLTLALFAEPTMTDARRLNDNKINKKCQGCQQTDLP